MEWIGPAIISVLVLSTLYQLVTAHSVSVIARKNDLGSMMEVFAWIPILQLVPMLAIGGGSIGLCLLGIVALGVGNGAVFGVAAVSGEGAGSVIGMIALGFTLVVCLAYATRICWTTATNRELPGWVGLLMFIPLVNLFVYPFIAFYDGWARPHVAGAVLGTIITVGSMLPYITLVDMLQNDEGLKANLARLSEAAESGELADLDSMSTTMPEMEDPNQPGAVPAALPQEIAQDQERSIRALFELKGQFEALDSLTSPENMRISDNRLRALQQIRKVRVELEARSNDVDEKTYTELASHLVRVEAIAQGLNPATSPGHVAMVQAARGKAGSTGPASLSSASSKDAAPISPFPVRVSDTCPYGTELRSRASEKGDEEWCQQLSQTGGLRHGWYARYFAAGQPEQVGEYDEGLRVGVWTRFHRSGEVRAQAEFAKGLQHGWLLSFDESGTRKQAVRFDQGAPVKQ